VDQLVPERLHHLRVVRGDVDYNGVALPQRVHVGVQVYHVVVVGSRLAALDPHILQIDGLPVVAQAHCGLGDLPRGGVLEDVFREPAVREGGAVPYPVPLRMLGVHIVHFHHGIALVVVRLHARFVPVIDYDRHGLAGDACGLGCEAQPQLAAQDGDVLFGRHKLDLEADVILGIGVERLRSGLR
jgi:hypothetical protein